MSAPTLSASDKSQVVQELQKTMAVQDKDNTIKNFLQTLAENNRLSVLEGVCEKFSTLMSAARGEVEMTITSAAPLENKMVKQLETAVSKSQYIGQGQKLKVVPKVSSRGARIEREKRYWKKAAKEKRIWIRANVTCLGRPGDPWRSHCRDWRPYHRPQRLGQDGPHEQASY